jgi:hypothetical protein
MKPLKEPDLLLLRLAQHWLDAGRHADALAESERVTPRFRAHPEMAKVRYKVHAQAGNWGACMDIARAAAAFAPNERFGPLALAYALRRAPGGGLRPALNALEAVADRIQDDVIPFTVACYSCQLGQLPEAKAWLVKAFRLARKRGRLRQVRRKALAERDLEPIWPEIGSLKP